MQQCYCCMLKWQWECATCNWLVYNCSYWLPNNWKKLIEKLSRNWIQWPRFSWWRFRWDPYSLYRVWWEFGEKLSLIVPHLKNDLKHPELAKMKMVWILYTSCANSLFENIPISWMLNLGPVWGPVVLEDDVNVDLIPFLDK